MTYVEQPWLAHTKSLRPKEYLSESLQDQQKIKIRKHPQGLGIVYSKCSKYTVRRCLGTQSSLQNHLQKGLEHKGTYNLLEYICGILWERKSFKLGWLGSHSVRNDPPRSSHPSLWRPSLEPPQKKCSGLFVISWEPKRAPPMPPTPRNKALLRDY